MFAARLPAVHISRRVMSALLAVVLSLVGLAAVPVILMAAPLEATSDHRPHAAAPGAPAKVAAGVTQQEGEEPTFDCQTPLDVVFVIDDTGSMGGALANINAEIDGILDEVENASNGDYQLGLFTFKDTVQQDVALSFGNRVALSAALAGLVASGGGGTPEASDEALNTVINSLAIRPGSDAFTGFWRGYATQIIILVTDAVPGGFDDTFTAGVDDVNAATRATEAATNGMIIGSVLVPTSGAGQPLLGIMQNYATTTGGEFVQTAPNGAGTGAALLQILQTLPVDLTIEKTGDIDIDAGEEAFFTITVCNNGPGDAQNVVVTDTLPSPLIFLDDTDACSVVGAGPGGSTLLSCNAGDLACGDCTEFVLKTRAPASAVQAELDGVLAVINQAGVTADNIELDPTDNTDEHGLFIQDEADLRVSKYVEPFSTVRAGSIFTYTIYVDNLGPSVSRNVTISDTLLSSGNVSIQSCAFSVSQGGGAITQFTCTTGPLVSTQFGTDIGTFRTNFLEALSPTSQGRLRASFRLVANEDIDVTNTVRVSANTPDPDMSNNFTSVNLSVTAVSDLSVVKAATGEEQQTNQPGLIFNNAIFGQVFPTAPNYFVSTRVTAGRRIQYRMDIRNDGPSEAENVVVRDRLPLGVRIYQGTLVVTVDNTGTPNPPPVVLPASACTQGTPGDPLDQLTCGLGVLQRGATATIVFEVITDSDIEPGSVLVNDAVITSDSFDIDNTDNVTSAEMTVLAAADNGVVKTAVGQVVTGYSQALGDVVITDLANAVTAGLLLRYQIQVQNYGPSLSQNTTIQDLLPAVPAPQPVTFVAAVGATCRPSTVNQQQIFCDIGDLDAGERRTFDVYVRVAENVPAGTALSNTANVLQSGSNVVPPGSPPSIPGLDPTREITWDPCTACQADRNNSSQNTTIVTAVSDARVNKEDVPAEPRLNRADEPDLAIAGNEHRYLISFGTSGPSTASGVTVIDTMDFMRPGVAGETFLRCEGVDPDTEVTCSPGPGANQVQLTTYTDDDGTAFSANTGTLEVGKTYRFYLVTRVAPGYVLDAIDLLATDTVAIATALSTDPNLANNTDTESTEIIAEADLAVTKTDIFGTDPTNGFLQCDPVARGGEVRYTITVDNRGPSDAAQVLLVDQLPEGLVLDPAEVEITVSEGQILDLNGPAPGLARDDGRIEILIGNDPNFAGTAQIGRMNAPGGPGAGSVTVTIVANVATTAPCGAVLTNTVTVSTVRNDTLWPPAPPALPGIPGVGAGPRTPTADPNPANNTANETTTVRCPSVKVTKTVSFDGTCPGSAVEQINLTGVPVTFCFEIENTGDTFLDTIQITDTLKLRTETTEVFTDTITFGADPLLPVAPGEKVLRQVTVPQLLAKWDCGLANDTVEVTAVPVNSGRTVYPCLPVVSDTDTATVAVPCAGVDFRLQLPIVGGTDCETWIQVQNVGSDFAKALLVFWGEPGFCPPQASGPLKAECSGLLKPGSAWSFAAGQVPNGANSAVIYSMNAVNSIRDIDGNLRPFADVACGALFDAIVGDWERWQAFDIAYRTRDIWRGPRDASGFQVVLDFGKNLGEPLAATVNRTCPDPTDPNIVSSAAYTGVSSDLEGAYDPLAGGYTSYAPMVLAQRGGLSSIIHIHNSGIECTSLEIWFKAQDACLRSTLGDVLTLSPGETVSFDVNTVVGPDWLGSAWIRASQPLGVVVDTVGPNHFTSYTGVPGDVYQLGFTYGDQVSFAPLIYNQMQGWDTALQVQNHSSHLNAKVKVYFLDQSGGVVSTVVDWICPRGSQTFFLPVIGGLPGNWVGSARVESQEWWSPGDPAVDPPTVSTTVLLEKWDDPARTNRREAVAYNGRGECLLYDWQIGSGDGGASSGSAVFAVPLLMKDYRGITSELAITNLVPKPGFTDFAIFIYDQNGLLDWVCQKLNEKQVEYINLASWGYVNPRFNGSAVISATFWEHDIFDKNGVFERNVVGLGGVAVERVGGILGGPDVPGDESKAFEAMPIFDFFDPPTAPNCPGVP